MVYHSSERSVIGGKNIWFGTSFSTLTYKIWTYILRCSPPIMFLVGDPYKPSLATVTARGSIVSIWIWLNMYVSIYFANFDIEMLIRCVVTTRSNICTWDHADVWCIDNQGPLLQMCLVSFLNAFSGLARVLERKLLSLLLLLLWVSLNCLFLIITICGIIISISIIIMFLRQRWGKLLGFFLDS